MKKLIIFDVFCSILVLMGLLGGILLPVTGELVLLDELCAGIMLLGSGLWCVKFVISMSKSGKDFLWSSLLVALFLIVSVVISKDAIHDIIDGRKAVNLYDCYVEKQETSKGITSLDYYLIGETKAGESYRFEISGSDYQRLESVSEVTVTGYLNSERIISYVPSGSRCTDEYSFENTSLSAGFRGH